MRMYVTICICVHVSKVNVSFVRNNTQRYEKAWAALGVVVIAMAISLQQYSLGSNCIGLYGLKCNGTSTRHALSDDSANVAIYLHFTLSPMHVLIRTHSCHSLMLFMLIDIHEV